MQSAQARALPRIGLLGNPSDGYGGRVLAFTFGNFSARVTAGVRDAGIVLRGPDGLLEARDHAELEASLRSGAAPGGPALLGAALLQRPAHLAVELAFTSDIPRQVGLSGSSAIVIACLRALDLLAGQADRPFEVAEAALLAETDVLGVTAGPQDRVIQAYEGFLAMDFQPPRSPEGYRRLDPAPLADLLLLYHPSPGESSGVAHADIRGRWEAGDPEVRAAIQRFVDLAREGEEALHDRARLADLLDESFDTRASIWPLSEVDHRLVQVARSCGCAAKLCGSGGAVVVLPRSAEAAARLMEGAEEAGLRCLRPTLAPGPPGAIT